MFGFLAVAFLLVLEVVVHLEDIEQFSIRHEQVSEETFLLTFAVLTRLSLFSVECGPWDV